MMGKFQRSPSKVWWAEDNVNNSASWRSASANSGSQDSGFSDTETSPAAQQEKNAKDKATLANSIAKGEKIDDNMSKQNLSSNIKEKVTPQKKISLELQKELLPRPDVNHNQHLASFNTTPKRRNFATQSARTAPVSRVAYLSHSQKVNRNLFKSAAILNISDNEIVRTPPDQYSKQHSARGTPEHLNISEDKVTSSNNSSLQNDSFESPQSVKSLPLVPGSPRAECFPHNLSAPAVLSDEDVLTPLNISSGDSDSELECLFRDDMVSPRHTSTPKTDHRKSERIDLRKKFAMNLLLKYQQNDRVPPTSVQNEEDKRDLQQWIKEVRHKYEPECMTALQCKSIAGELAEKVNQLAAAVTLTIRDIISYQTIIEQEFENLKNQKKHIKPLMQSLCGIISEFLQKYSIENNCTLQQLCENIKTADEIELNKIMPKFYVNFKTTYQKILTKEVKKFIEELEDPYSEIHVRAMLTGLTSVASKNEDLVTLFTKGDTIQILVILCEKCEGSTVRALTLRALTTICTKAAAVRQFEKASGIQVIVDILTDESRPEPERSEAAALLVQITAPWLEDNHNISGLAEHDKKLVKSITKFITTTKCCQNLLLCAAALAHLSTMENNSIRYILYYNTVGILLKSIKKRGPRASVYLLEQAATLLANVSAIEEARKQLTKDGGPSALLCFLQTTCIDDELIRRLQKKSMVALSRLCSEPEASKQIVELGGVDRLIHLCREKDERCNSDAVLVAALVTLRKIIETCGSSVMSTQDVQELVEPRLLDSFLAYSTQNESYV